MFYKTDNWLLLLLSLLLLLLLLLRLWLLRLWLLRLWLWWCCCCCCRSIVWCLFFGKVDANLKPIVYNDNPVRLADKCQLGAAGWCQILGNRHCGRLRVSQRSLHNAPIFRLLLKVAVNGTHQCDFLNFCGPLGVQH